MVQFADCSTSTLEGKVALSLRLGHLTGPQFNLVFYVLRGLTCDMLIGEDLLNEINAFQTYGEAFREEDRLNFASELNPIVWLNHLESKLSRIWQSFSQPWRKVRSGSAKPGISFYCEYNTTSWSFLLMLYFKLSAVANCDPQQRRTVMMHKKICCAKPSRTTLLLLMGMSKRMQGARTIFEEKHMSDRAAQFCNADTITAHFIVYCEWRIQVSAPRLQCSPVPHTVPFEARKPTLLA